MRGFAAVCSGMPPTGTYIVLFDYAYASWSWGQQLEELDEARLCILHSHDAALAARIADIVQKDASGGHPVFLVDAADFGEDWVRIDEMIVHRLEHWERMPRSERASYESAVVAATVYAHRIYKRLIAAHDAPASPADAVNWGFRQIAYFPEHMQERIEKAGRPDRKRKRVEVRVEDGVRLYSLSDVWKWWPDEMIEEGHAPPGDDGGR